MDLLGIVAGLALAMERPLGAGPPAAVPIYGGEHVAPGEWPSVVAIDIGGYGCSGTLVAPSLVLTAAHCLVAAQGASAITVRRGENVTQSGSVLAVAAYGYDPEYCPATRCTADIHDYGYLVLATPQYDIPAFPRTISDQGEWDRLMAVGRPLVLVGYGEDEVQAAGIKRQVEVEITRLSPSGLEFEAGGMGRDSCLGDSGGAAFARLDSGEWLLVGITSRGYTCGEGGIYEAPLGGLCWLQRASGFDLRPTDCEACDCIDTDPARDEGCGCASGGEVPPALGLGGPLVLLARRRRLTRS